MGMSLADVNEEWRFWNSSGFCSLGKLFLCGDFIDNFLMNSISLRWLIWGGTAWTVEAKHFSHEYIMYRSTVVLLLNVKSLWITMIWYYIFICVFKWQPRIKIHIKKALYYVTCWADLRTIKRDLVGCLFNISKHKVKTEDKSYLTYVRR